MFSLASSSRFLPRVFANGSSGTYVGGIIWENTTWTLENSPYIITETVQISERITLTIEPGVVINAGPGIRNMFLVHGEIYAHGTADKMITFNGEGRSNFFSAKGSEMDAFVDLEHCIIKNGLSLWPPTGYVQYGHFILRYSKLINLSSYSYVWYPRSDVYIEHNLFVDSAGFSIGHNGPSVYIRYNLFIRNVGVLVENWASYSGQTVVQYNSFIDTSGIVLKLPSGYDHAAMIATENYWSTTGTDVIDSMIYDKNDDITCAGFIEYLPILTEPHPDTPTLPLIVNFTYSPSVLYANSTVIFDASAGYGPYSCIANYTWDFGDGNKTTLMAPIITHNYANPGSYEVILTVTDEFGFKNSTSTTIVVLRDNNPPLTTHDYDGLWHNKDFMITLSSIDNETGVAENYYRINDGPVRAVSVDGQPVITTESATNTLEYWSVDNAGNEEEHHILTGIKLDKIPPSSSLAKSGSLGENDWYVSDVIVSVNSADSLSGINNIKYSFDNVSWTQYTDHIIISNEGETTVYYRAIDNAGNIEPAKTGLIKIDKTIPVANAGSDCIVMVGDSIVFDASNSTDNIGIMSYEWDFGDGTTGTGMQVTKSYSNPGTYTVTLTVKDAAGNTAIATLTVTAKDWLSVNLPYLIAEGGLAIVAIALAVWVIKRRK